MKKKSIFILSILIFTLALSACSPEGLSYLNDIQKVQKWEAMEQELKTVVNVKLPKAELESGELKELKEMGIEIPENYKITIDSKGYSNNDIENPESKMIMNIKDESGLFNIENVEILVNKESIYVSKNYFETLLSLDENLKSQIPEGIKYFSLSTGMDSEEYLKIAKLANSSDYVKEMSVVLKSLELDLDIKKENNTYTIELDSDKLINLVEQSINNFFKNPNKIIDALKEVKALGVDKEELDLLKESFKEFDKESLGEMKTFMNEAKAKIKGSTVKIVETITDNTYDSKSDLNINIEGFANAKIDSTTKTNKAGKQIITFPKKEDVADYAEFMESITPKIKMLSIDKDTSILSDYSVEDFDDMDKDIAIKEFDKVEMYGFRRIFEALGFKVDYDKTKEKPLYILDGEKVYLDIPESNGISYISIEKLKELGLEVEEYENIISITYTIEPEAKTTK